MARTDPSRPTVGWRWMWYRWHYFQEGESLCGKFTMQILGGGQPARGFKAALTQEDLQHERRICDGCIRGGTHEMGSR